MSRTTHTAVGKGCSTWTLHHAVRGMLRTCMYRTCHGTTAGTSHGPTPHGREREFSKPEGKSMNTTEAATDSCWSVCHSLRSMVCTLIRIAHCTSTHQVPRRGCARQLLHVPLGRAPRALRAGTGQATHLPITRAPRLHLQ